MSSPCCQQFTARSFEYSLSLQRSHSSAYGKPSVIGALANEGLTSRKIKSSVFLRLLTHDVRSRWRYASVTCDSAVKSRDGLWIRRCTPADRFYPVLWLLSCVQDSTANQHLVVCLQRHACFDVSQNRNDMLTSRLFIPKFKPRLSRQDSNGQAKCTSTFRKNACSR